MILININNVFVPTLIFFVLQHTLMPRIIFGLSISVFILLLIQIDNFSGLSSENQKNRRTDRQVLKKVIADVCMYIEFEIYKMNTVLIQPH